MLGSGWGGLLLHALASLFFFVWLLLAVVVQLVTVSKILDCVATFRFYVGAERPVFRDEAHGDTVIFRAELSLQV